MATNLGYIELTKGKFVGELSIDGVDISPVVGYYFREGKEQWLWIKRQSILEYNFETESFKTKNPSPQFEVYLKKAKKPIDYQGKFVFFKFKYLITGVFDEKEKAKQRLNLYVERCPMSEQHIINKINDIRNETRN